MTEFLSLKVYITTDRRGRKHKKTDTRKRQRRNERKTEIEREKEIERETIGQTEKGMDQFGF